jgi:chromosome segregation ATPase
MDINRELKLIDEIKKLKSENRKLKKENRERKNGIEHLTNILKNEYEPLIDDLNEEIDCLEEQLKDFNNNIDDRNEYDKMRDGEIDKIIDDLDNVKFENEALYEDKTDINDIITHCLEVVDPVIKDLETLLSEIGNPQFNKYMFKEKVIELIDDMTWFKQEFQKIEKLTE